MTVVLPIQRFASRLRRDESGATLVEFTLVLALFLLLVFGLIDFGRLFHHYVSAEKAVQMAARIATVRPPLCPAVPKQNNLRGSTFYEYGTACSTANACAAPLDSPHICTATVAVDSTNPESVAAGATADEIWAAIEPLLPNGTTRDNLRFTYSYSTDVYDPIGFLGGPYTPVVTVDLVTADEAGAVTLPFNFTSPLGALAGLATGTGSYDLPMTIRFPAMSVSIPGEDLSQGEAG